MHTEPKVSQQIQRLSRAWSSSAHGATDRSRDRHTQTDADTKAERQTQTHTQRQRPKQTRAHTPRFARCVSSAGAAHEHHDREAEHDWPLPVVDEIEPNWHLRHALAALKPTASAIGHTVAQPRWKKINERAPTTNPCKGSSALVYACACTCAFTTACLHGAWRVREAWLCERAEPVQTHSRAPRLGKGAGQDVDVCALVCMRALLLARVDTSS
eukprot:6196196-Pleurochrysis_carterae.AAC.2